MIEMVFAVVVIVMVSVIVMFVFGGYPMPMDLWAVQRLCRRCPFS